MNIRKMILTAAWLLSVFNLHAQDFTPIATPKSNRNSSMYNNALTIGDKVPDLFFNTMLNYKSTTAKFSSLRGKLTILDFWNSGCSSCIELFPHMQQLKTKYGRNLNIILVNGKSKIWHDNKAKIESILKRSASLTGVKITLPVIYNNQPLDNYFPSLTIPHEVWLDSTGKVLAITSSREVTEENISAFLRGEKPVLPLKRDIAINLQQQSLMAVSGDLDRQNRPYFSSTLFKGFINGLHNVGFRTRPDGLITGWYLTNYPILRIYKVAYPQLESLPDNRIVVEASQPDRFLWPMRDTLPNYNNFYSYEAITQPMKREQIIKYVQADLEKMFHTSVSVANKSVDAYIIYRDSTLSLPVSKGGKLEYLENRGSKEKHIRNFPFQDLVKELDIAYMQLPLIDESNVQESVDLVFPDGKITQQVVIQVLRQNGFKVTLEKRLLRVGVIADKQDF